MSLLTCVVPSFLKSISRAHSRQRELGSCSAETCSLGLCRPVKHIYSMARFDPFPLRKQLTPFHERIAIRFDCKTIHTADGFWCSYVSEGPYVIQFSDNCRKLLGWRYIFFLKRCIVCRASKSVAHRMPD